MEANQSRIHSAASFLAAAVANRCCDLRQRFEIRSVKDGYTVYDACDPGTYLKRSHIMLNHD